MPHWIFWIVTVAVFILLAITLEYWRSVWYLKWNAVVAAGGIALAGLCAIAMMTLSNDLPLHLTSLEFGWWVIGQMWIIFGCAAVVILIWDKWFVDKSLETRITVLEKSLAEANTELANRGK